MEMGRVLRVMLVDGTPRRVSSLRNALDAAEISVAARLSSTADWQAQVASVRPDVIIIHTESPSRGVLERIAATSRGGPPPMVMFTGDDSSESIQAAIGAGVAAYVVDRNLEPGRIRSILQVAMVRFQQEQALRSRLADAESRLAERKLTERAKGIIMEKRGVNEAEAYRLLRKMAMDRNQRLAEVARQIISVADVFG
ncbi:MAG: ANTAR domain-containing protein [Betaproteobacteria bacterium]|nr:ANTAR domain-containing protein [Betaproteobacteria bacterium]